MPTPPGEQPKEDAVTAPLPVSMETIQAMFTNITTMMETSNANLGARLDKMDARFLEQETKLKAQPVLTPEIKEDPSGIVPKEGGASDDSGTTPGDPEQVVETAKPPNGMEKVMNGVYNTSSSNSNDNTSSGEPKFSPKDDSHFPDEEKTVPRDIPLYVTKNMSDRECFLLVQKWKVVKFSETGIIVKIPEHRTIRDSVNMMNGFEETIQGDDETWLKTFPIIRHRTPPGNDMTRFEEYNSKLDNLFINQCPAFTKADKDQFQTYVEKFWEVAVRHRIEGTYFAKSQLFNQINLIYPEVCSEELKPVNETVRKLTFKGYVIQILQKFQPSNMKEIAKARFEIFGQYKKNIDIYFDGKLKLFHIAYGRKPSEMDYHNFFGQFHKRLESRKLARMMADERRRIDMKDPDMGSYKNTLLICAQTLLEGVRDGYYNAADAKGCKSLSYSGLNTEDSKGKQGDFNNPITIGQVEDNPPIEVSDSDQEDADQEPEEGEEDEDQILAFNRKAKDKNNLALKCHFCSKIGHTINSCWDKEQNKPPHPYGVVGLEQKKWEQRKPTKKPEKGEKKKNYTSANKNTHQLEDQEEGDDQEGVIATMADHEAFLHNLNDLSFLPTPLESYDLLDHYDF